MDGQDGIWFGCCPKHEYGFCYVYTADFKIHITFGVVCCIVYGNLYLNLLGSQMGETAEIPMNL